MRCLLLVLAVLLLAPAVAAASLGPPPPDCGVAGKDFTDPSCTAQSRNGTFHFDQHQVKRGGTLKGSVTALCRKHSTGDLSKPADQVCPIDWSPLLAIGKKVSGCTMQSPSCVVRISATAKLSQTYTIVQIGITSDQGTGYSKDYFAIVK